MSRVAPFHSLNESRKTAPRYHTDDACSEAQSIREADLRPGSGGYYQCELCAKSAAEAEEPNDDPVVRRTSVNV